LKGALVTGAGVRIGRALAMALAEDGFFVFVHYNLSAAGAKQTVADIQAKGGKAKVVKADLASAKQAEALVGRCTAPGVKLVCAVNNASIFELDRAPTATAAAFDRHMAINARAPLLIAQALTRQLPKGEVGLIVNLEDQKLFNLNPDFLTYTVSKIGLHGITHLLAQALASGVPGSEEMVRRLAFSRSGDDLQRITAALTLQEAGLIGPLEGVVEYAEALGRETFLGVRRDGGPRLVVCVEGRSGAQPGDRVTYGLVPGGLRYFDAQSGNALETPR